MNTVWHLVSGILCWPGASKLWSRRGVIWIDENTPDKAIACEYFCTAIFRAFHNRSRADKLNQQMRGFSKGWNQNVIAHSNGTDVFVDMMRSSPIEVGTAHLVSAACEADFNVNGLNRRLASGQVGRVVVWRSGADRALALAHTMPGRLLGYGILGLSGPINVFPSVRDRVLVRDWPGWGHSTCWESNNFEATMRSFAESN